MLIFCLLAVVFLFIIVAAFVMPRKSKSKTVANSFDKLKGNYVFRFAAVVLLPLLIVSVCAMNDRDNTDSFLLGVFTLALLTLATVFSVSRIPRNRETILTNPTLA